MNALPEWMATIDKEDLIVAENAHQLQQYKTIFISDTHLGSKGAKAEFLAEFVSATGERYLVVHGDKYDSVIQTQKWLAIIGDWGYETLVLLNRHFNHLRRKLGFGYWSLSSYVKQKVKGAVSFISAYEEAVVKDCKVN